MSVLKPSQNDRCAVRAFHFAPPGPPDASTETPVERAAPQPQAAGKAPSAKEERLALARRIAELEEALSKASVAAKTDAEDARKGGIEEGRKLGREEAKSTDQERLALLEKSLEKASEDTRALLDDKLELAADLARAALARILGDTSHYAGLVHESAMHWQANLAGSKILKVRVSERDFAEDILLLELRQRMAAIVVETDAKLDPGACIFDLELGEVDASIPLQAERADSLLRELSTTEAQA